MPENKIPPKPKSEEVRPEIVRLPQISPWRRLVRRLLRWLVSVLVNFFTRLDVTGLENVPRKGPALLVSNHLGDADAVIGIALCPVPVDLFVKAELYDYPVLGMLLELYGVIWIHRGQPDRRALRAALDGLGEGRLLAIAPEGRESVTGALEEGTGGAAYLALKAGAPVVPVTFTGTDNETIFTNLKRLRRSKVTVVVGEPFELEKDADRRQAISNGTRQIMLALAAQLPPAYRGIYQQSLDKSGKDAGSSGREVIDGG